MRLVRRVGNSIVPALQLAWAVLAGGFRPALRDLAGMAGAGAIVYGIDQMHRPSALIVGGLLLLAGAVLDARRS